MVISNELRTILTTNDGEALATALSTHFGMPFSVTQAENVKKILCCADISVSRTLTRLYDATMLNADEFALGMTGATAIQEYADVIE